MKFLPLSVPLLLSLPLHAETSTNSVIGEYEVLQELSGQRSTIHLKCETATECKLTFGQNKYPSIPPEVHQLKAIHEVDNVEEAKNALSYAITNLDQTKLDDHVPGSWPFQLKKELAQKPSISKCWDLNFNEPSYLLACKLKTGEQELKPMYLFMTQLSNCNTGFCRYMIIPSNPR